MDAVPPELWIARHGETEWTLARRHTGRTDIPLTAAGELQAGALAETLSGTSFDAVLSSPLRRATETARLAGYTPELDDRLRELDYGDFEGVTTVEIRKAHPGWVVWDGPMPGGETVEDVGRRTDALIADLRTRGERVLVIGHGHALRILTARWLGLHPREGRAFLLAPAGVGVLGSEHGLPAISRWNP